MKSASKLLLFIILIFASLLRFYEINRFPQGLYWDEVAIGYNAYSIIKTGSDEYGKFLPITFESFQDSKLPGYIYLTSLSELLFGLTPFAVRFVSILSGIISVFFVYAITKELSSGRNLNKVPYVAALFMSISPWALQFSRAGFEANTALTISLVAVYFFIRFVKSGKFFYRSIIFTVLSFYFYYQEWVFFPLFILTVILLLYKSIYLSFKQIIKGFILGFILLIPLIYAFFLSGSETRLSHVDNILKDPEVIKESIQLRSGEDNVFLGTLLHNRHSARLNAFSRSYISHFSPEYLFFTGDGNPRHSVSDIGMMHTFLLPFFVLGLIYIVSHQRFARVILVLWLIYSPISASVSTPVPHSLRSLLMLPVVEIIAAYGFIWFVTYIKRHTSKLIYTMSLCIFLLIYGYYFMNYLYQYYVASSKNSSYWAYGHEELFTYTQSVRQDYDKIYVTGHYWRPYIFMLFYTAYPPHSYQENGSHTEIGQYRFGHASYDSSDPHYVYSDTLVDEIRNEGNNLLVLAPGEVKEDDHVIKTINFLNNTPAFVIVKSRPEMKSQ